MKLHEENEPFLITEDMAAEMAAAGYEFKPLGHARTKSVRDLYGWQPGETLEQAIARQQRRQCSSSGSEHGIIHGISWLLYCNLFIFNMFFDYR
ncbi:hypothetical protein [Xanthomonas hortorum]|uniref:Uncharacterized protein n=1 Tax=Xanthomonas hortorum pv. hederae TaxID=453603 RepID=A0A9X4H545_9XANT|nr:hypothetical protein [Xanthomonas hortorum pv. hederae]MDC8639594.1 hypothetical protein [Xanthomonas hortorum pv. hederae]